MVLYFYGLNLQFQVQKQNSELSQFYSQIQHINRTKNPVQHSFFQKQNSGFNSRSNSKMSYLDPVLTNQDQNWQLATSLPLIDPQFYPGYFSTKYMLGLVKEWGKYWKVLR
jgi:hypothetical protein